LKSEEVLIASACNYTILRTILVYGKVFDMSSSNLVLWVKKMLEDKKEITIVDNIADLALTCKIAMDKKVTGIFHVSSKELLSIYKIAQQIATVFQLDKRLIKPI
jgi:dTDP-4-dehydrorhamnose reductase